MRNVFFIKNRNGSTLVLMLTVIALLAILVASILAASVGNLMLSSNYLKSNTTYYQLDGSLSRVKVLLDLVCTDAQLVALSAADDVDIANYQNPDFSYDISSYQSDYNIAYKYAFERYFSSETTYNNKGYVDVNAAFTSFNSKTANVNNTQFITPVTFSVESENITGTDTAVTMLIDVTVNSLKHNSSTNSYEISKTSQGGFRLNSSVTIPTLDIPPTPPPGQPSPTPITKSYTFNQSFGRPLTTVRDVIVTGGEVTAQAYTDTLGAQEVEAIYAYSTLKDGGDSLVLPNGNSYGGVVVGMNSTLASNLGLETTSGGYIEGDNLSGKLKTFGSISTRGYLHTAYSTVNSPSTININIYKNKDIKENGLAKLSNINDGENKANVFARAVSTESVCTNAYINITGDVKLLKGIAIEGSNNSINIEGSFFGLAGLTARSLVNLFSPPPSPEPFTIYYNDSTSASIISIGKYIFAPGLLWFNNVSGLSRISDIISASGTNNGVGIGNNYLSVGGLNKNSSGNNLIEGSIEGALNANGNLYWPSISGSPNITTNMDNYMPDYVSKAVLHNANDVLVQLNQYKNATYINHLDTTLKLLRTNTPDDPEPIIKQNSIKSNYDASEHYNSMGDYIFRVITGNDAKLEFSTIAGKTGVIISEDNLYIHSDSPTEQTFTGAIFSGGDIIFTGTGRKKIIFDPYIVSNAINLYSPGSNVLANIVFLKGSNNTTFIYVPGGSATIPPPTFTKNFPMSNVTVKSWQQTK